MGRLNTRFNQPQTQSETHPLPEEVNRTLEPPSAIDGDGVPTIREKINYLNPVNSKIKIKPKLKLKPQPTPKRQSLKERSTLKLYNKLVKTLQNDRTP